MALAHARDGVPQEGLVSALRDHAHFALGVLRGVPVGMGSLRDRAGPFLPVLAGSWGRELPFPVLKIQVARALAR